MMPCGDWSSLDNQERNGGLEIEATALPVASSSGPRVQRNPITGEVWGSTATSWELQGNRTGTNPVTGAPAQPPKDPQGFKGA